MPGASLIVQDHAQSIKDHVVAIEAADYGLPEFQRTFVWDDTRVLRLWESLHMGYPIGQLMLWEDPGDEFPMRALGRNQHALAQTSEYAVIDGQQRLTAIWLVLKGEVQLRFNLERGEFVYGRLGENSIALDILKDQTLEQAEEWNYFFYHATGDQQKRFARALNTLNATFTGRTIPFRDQSRPV